MCLAPSRRCAIAGACCITASLLGASPSVWALPSPKRPPSAGVLRTSFSYFGFCSSLYSLGSFLYVGSFFSASYSLPSSGFFSVWAGAGVDRRTEGAGPGARVM